MWTWFDFLDLLWILRFFRKLDGSSQFDLVCHFSAFWWPFFVLVFLPRNSAFHLIDTLHIFLISSGYTQSGSSSDAPVHRDS
jgi:hypothetical protein